MQYIVDSYSKMEDGRVSFIRHNQEKLRCDTYKNIKDGNPDQLGELIYSIALISVNIFNYSSQKNRWRDRQENYSPINISR